ncbi:hypothetical protein [Fusobacterium ulcerans]|nr:hypothetical protein [Fusobacterium ulcerans]
MDYLLNLTIEEQTFFIQAMLKEKEEQILYDESKMEVFLKAFGGGRT